MVSPYRSQQILSWPTKLLSTDNNFFKKKKNGLKEAASGNPEAAHCELPSQMLRGTRAKLPVDSPHQSAMSQGLPDCRFSLPAKCFLYSLRSL